jgi:hypothetical protein
MRSLDVLAMIRLMLSARMLARTGAGRAAAVGARRSAPTSARWRARQRLAGYAPSSQPERGLCGLCDNIKEQSESGRLLCVYQSYGYF